MRLKTDPTTFTWELTLGQFLLCVTANVVPWLVLVHAFLSKKPDREQQFGYEAMCVILVFAVCLIVLLRMTCKTSWSVLVPASLLLSSFWLVVYYGPPLRQIGFPWIEFVLWQTALGYSMGAALDPSRYNKNPWVMK
jgi:hypothetical protein